MLDVKFIRENLERVKETAELKRCQVDFDSLLSLDTKRRALLQEVDQKKNIRNQATEAIARAKRDGAAAEEKILEMRALSEEIKQLDNDVAAVEVSLEQLLAFIPNLADASVPRGKDASANVVVKEWGQKRDFSFDAKDHMALTEENGWVDFRRGARMSGSGFALFKGEGARLERALIQFMLDHHVRRGYTEVSPPFLVNRQSMFGTGQIPKLEEDMYALKEEDLFLIPTAEVPVTNIHREEVLTEQELPLRYVAYTPCFRREAGSYGKDTKGLSRVHQFDKVELVKFSTAESSYAEHEQLLQDAESVLQALGLPYRVLLLAAGDMSFAAAKCYDLEVWAPGSKRWFEVSSCSNFEDFQARRAQIRYREKATGKTRFAHTLNASGIALPRTMIALLETYQQEDGSVALPEILAPYLRR